jgi:ubiquinone/menaquinone biosynthesis C-methylase UbiE
MPSPQSPAETYEGFMVPFRFRPWANELIDRVTLQSGTRMLDIACGTGIVARVAAQRMQGTGMVVGIDLNPAMIEVAARAAAQEGVSIDWQTGNAESLPFADQSFDLVTIQQGLQFFPDQRTALRECLRVLAPGGSLLVGIWSTVEKQGIQQHYADAIAKITGTASMNTPYGTVTDESLRDLLASAGFIDIEIEEVTIELIYDDAATFAAQMVESTSAGVPAMQGRSDEERAALSADVTAEMSDAVRLATVDGQLITHSTTFIARAKRPAA